MSKFLKGIIILMTAGLLSRVLGFINRIVIARMIGEEGVGLYMMAYPTLILVVTLTQIGLPVAISKTVAEAEAKGDRNKTKKILAVSLAITITLSLFFTAALMVSAPIISQILFTDPRTYYPLIAMTPIIPIVAVSSVIRGYFQGKQNMKPAAIAQVLEQAVRIGLIALFAKTFLPYGIEYAAAAAMVASVIGELASLLYLFTMFKVRKSFRLRKKFFSTIKEGKQTLSELMSVAIPATGSRMIGSLSWFFEPIVVSQSLLIAGFAAGVATKQYGLLTGYALPLLMLPSFITFSLATSLVPAISEASARNNFLLVEHRLQQALRLAMLSGGISAVLLFIFAHPIMKLLYGSENGAEFIQLIAPFVLFHYYQGPLQAILQALNLARAAMINSFIGAVVKIIVIFALASQPFFGINGAALGIATSMVLVTILHFATVLKRIQFTIYVFDYVKFIAIAIFTGWFGTMVYRKFSFSSIPNLFFSIIITCCIYLLLIVIFKLVKKSDLIKIPIIKNFIK